MDSTIDQIDNSDIIENTLNSICNDSIKTTPKKKGKHTKINSDVNLEINSINEDTLIDPNNNIDYSNQSKANKTKNKQSREPKDNLDSNSKPKKIKTNSKKDLAMTFIPTDDNFINSGSKLFNSRTVNLTNSLSQTNDKIKLDKSKPAKDME